MTNDGTLTGGNSIPKVLSHEICEACSDPDLGSGILVDVGPSDPNEEIGDVCNNTWSTVNGAAQEAYWSESDNRCVIPVWQPFPPTSGNPVGPGGTRLTNSERAFAARAKRASGIRIQRVGEAAQKAPGRRQRPRSSRTEPASHFGEKNAGAPCIRLTEAGT